MDLTNDERSIESKQLFLNFIKDSPGEKLLILAVSLFRFLRSGYFIDFLVSLAFLLILDYLWFLIKNNNKAKNILNRINNFGGTGEKINGIVENNENKKAPFILKLSWRTIGLIIILIFFFFYLLAVFSS